MGAHKRHVCSCGSGKHKLACCDRPTERFDEPYNLVIDATPEEEDLQAAAERLSRTGRHRDACNLFEELVALNPDNPVNWNSLGNEFEAMGEKDKAWQILKRGHEVDPEFPSTLYNLGNLLLDRCVDLHNRGTASMPEVKKLALEAIGYFDKCLSRHPSYADCQYNAAIAHWLNRDSQRANVHMSEAIRLNPKFNLPPGWRIERGQR